MVKELVASPSFLPPMSKLEELLNRGQARRVGRFERFNDAAMAAIEEMSHNTAFAAAKAESTLQFIQALRQARSERGESPAQDRAEEYLAEQYLGALSSLVDVANSQVMLALERMADTESDEPNEGLVVRFVF